MASQLGDAKGIISDGYPNNRKATVRTSRGSDHAPRMPEQPKLKITTQLEGTQTYPFPTQMPFRRHINTPHHCLSVAHFTCKDEARSRGMDRFGVDPEHAEVHREHAKRLVGH